MPSTAAPLTPQEEATLQTLQDRKNQAALASQEETRVKKLALLEPFLDIFTKEKVDAALPALLTMRKNAESIEDMNRLERISSFLSNDVSTILNQIESLRTPVQSAPIPLTPSGASNSSAAPSDSGSES